MTTVPLVADVEGLTAAWLSAALGAEVVEVSARPVGTGQIGTCHRLTLTGDPSLPATLLAKLPAADPAARELLANPYRTELRFYREIAPTVAVHVPRAYYAAVADEGGDFVLLLEDLAPAEQGDQVAGCTPAQVEDAAVNLAGLHGPRWCDATLLEIEGLALSTQADADLMADLLGPATETFLDNLGDQVSAEDAETLRAVATVIGRWAMARPERFGLVHGDYRLDNLLFPPHGGPGVAAVDWQTLSLGLPARDLAYLVATSLDPAPRRETERSLVEAYHAALVGHGVTSYSLEEECWDDYRFGLVQGPLVSVFGQAYGARTERGDRMFAVMVARSCAAIRDLGTLELV